MFAFWSSLRTIRRALAVSLIACSWGSAAAQNNPHDREKLISWFQHQEDLVKSMYAEFEDVALPTTPQQAAVIRQAFHEWKQDQLYERTLMTPERARNLSHVEQWWRKGPKERFNSFYSTDFAHLSADLSQLSPNTTLAKDGEFVRDLDHHNETQGGPVAAIYIEKNSHWNKATRAQPFSFLYVYCETPYTQLIREATTFHSAAIIRDGKRQLQVSFTCSDNFLKNRALALFFDEQHRLVERQEFEKVPSGKLQLDGKQVASDYRAYPHPSGETIWFPDEVIYRSYYTLSNGAALEAFTKKLRVRNLQFNIEIPDDFFELKIPNNAKIYDGVTGVGWLPEGQRPDVLFPAEARARRWTWTAIGTLTTILVLALAFVAVRRRWNLGRTSPAPGGY